MKTEKHNIREYDNLLTGGKTVYIDGEKHDVKEYDNLLTGGKSVYIDGEKHDVKEYDNLLTGGKSVYIDGEKHDIKTYDNLLTGGKTIYDNGERHDVLVHDNFLTGGKTVYHTAYDDHPKDSDASRDEYTADSSNRNPVCQPDDEEIRKYSKMTPPHTRFQPDYDPEYKVLTFSVLWFLAVGLLAMVNLGPYMSGPLGFLFLGFCFLYLTDRGIYTGWHDFVPVFHIFMGLGILSLLPVMGPKLSTHPNVFLGLIFLMFLDILFSIVTDLGKSFWVFGFAVIGLYCWHWEKWQAAGVLLAIFMLIFVAYTVLHFHPPGTKIEKSLAKPKKKNIPDQKMILRNVLAGFIPPLAAIITAGFYKTGGAFVYMAAVIAVAIRFIPKRKYSLYYTAFLSVGTSFLFGWMNLSMVTFPPAGPTSRIAPVWNFIFHNPVSRFLSSGILGTIDGLWEIIPYPVNQVFHLLSAWGSSDPVSAARVVITGFLYLFMIAVGMITARQKNKKNTH